MHLMNGEDLPTVGGTFQNLKVNTYALDFELFERIPLNGCWPVEVSGSGTDDIRDGGDGPCRNQSLRLAPHAGLSTIQLK